MKRAALYIRVSTLDQHPETQLHELRQFASQRGFEIVDEYTDHGISTIQSNGGKIAKEIVKIRETAKVQIERLRACLDAPRPESEAM
jgi:DNA invertase Pin-like site-specific DNA recombinase